ncbi:hypothetical protein LTR37_012235 [Vermiconidia calcicola]|uniref:Uncharacterized protein n=1 Tax=Vermiconidia calcicola TaxID=1690605 RepID=A0ACC3MZS5_9PEZI|nr:hypothetical protein LTR37_012235 [Vermiconidia calcicola]
MGITTHTDISDKENYAPSSQVSYPELPRLSPSKRPTGRSILTSPPKKKRQTANYPQPWGSPTNTYALHYSNRSPANTARRRAPATLNGLTRTPPRPSYADKLKGIFTDSASTANASSRRAKASTSNGSTSSTLTSEPELERKLAMALDTPMTCGDQSRHIQPANPVMTPDMSTPFNTAASPCTPAPAQEESSSEEWTGDEEFIPRSVRRQNRIRRRYERQKALELERAEKFNVGGGGPMSLSQLRTAARYRETRNLLGMVPVSPPKSSRSTAPPRVIGTNPEPQSNASDELVNDRPSDADDEADEDE